MTDIILIDALIQFTAISVPDEITATITGINGQIMTIDQTFAENTWQGGVVELSSGSMAGLSQVIGASAANQLTLTAKYYPGRHPQVGDTVRIHGGPLSIAVLYNGDPDEIKDAWDNGRRFFATFRVPEGTASLKGGGGRREGGINAYRNAYGIEVVVFTKDYTGDSIDTEALKAFRQLPIFREQILIRMFAFGNRASSGINGAGEIHFGEIFLQKPGASPLRGYIIEADYEIA